MQPQAQTPNYGRAARDTIARVVSPRRAAVGPAGGPGQRLFCARSQPREALAPTRSVAPADLPLWLIHGVQIRRCKTTAFGLALDEEVGDVGN
jgi:hypothetical protein